MQTQHRDADGLPLAARPGDAATNQTASVADQPGIAEVAVFAPIRHSFDYRIPEHASSLQPGHRVSVPFGRGRRTGIVLACKTNTDVESTKLKSIFSVLDDEPVLDRSLLELLVFIARYCHHPPGDVAATMLPSALRAPQALDIRLEARVSLSEKGRAALSSSQARTLRRAPRRRELLEQLSSQTQPLAVSALDGGASRWGRVIAAAKAQGLVTVEHHPPAKDANGNCDGQTPPKPLEPVHVLNAAQQRAVEAVQAADGFHTYLLQGVTGSGKTEVYLALTQFFVTKGRQVLVLVPEIGLTPQLQARFQARLGQTLVSIHSGLSDRQRLDAWQQAASGRARVVLGTRSALFTPLPELGFVVIDEEHDLSFKQQDGLRYSARDLAVFRSRQAEIPVVLGSATPSLESLHNVARGRYTLLRLAQRAADAVVPSIELLDMRGRRLREGLSDELVEAIEQTVLAQEQVILFINRRGFANVLLCRNCGLPLECPRCDARLVYHRHDQRLRCHHCALEKPMLDACPSCQGPLLALGQGTQRVVEFLTEFFPGTRVARFDRDSVSRAGALDSLLQRMRDREIDVLVGTQMVAKGHDFPAVTLSAVVDADAGLFSTDFRALERMAQLLVQVAGRAGRAQQPGRVIIQTHHPDHPMLSMLLRDGYEQLALSVLAERESLGLPPFSHQALVRSSAADPARAQALLRGLAEHARSLLTSSKPSRGPGPRSASSDSPLLASDSADGLLAASSTASPLRVLGPVPAPMARRANRYHFQLLLEAAERGPLHWLIEQLLQALDGRSLPRDLRWSLDIDPQETG